MEKSLKTLIKLTKEQLDAQRRELVSLERKVAYVEKQIIKTQNEKETQISAVQDLEVPFTDMPHYINRMNNHVQLLNDQLKSLLRYVDRQKDLVAQTYETLKKYEITLENHQSAAAAAAEHKAQQLLDEIALQKYRKNIHG